VISESLVGSVEAPRYKNTGLSLEGVLPTRTWWSAAFNRLQEDVARTTGAFEILRASVFPNGIVIVPAGAAQNLAYREGIFDVGVNQLVGAEFALGAAYRRNRARLHNRYPQVPGSLSPNADRVDRATLDELALHANWNSPRGWFGRAEANGYSQDMDATAGGLPTHSPPGDTFWQFHARVGYRFHRNLREVSGGVLNLTDRDYRLSPLTYTRDLLRKRTFFVSCRVSF
jgi:hypothetical protein